MEWLEAIGGILGAAGTGGILGVIGGFLKMKENIEVLRLKLSDKKDEREHARLSQELEIKGLLAEHKAKIEIVRTESDAMLAQGLQRIQTQIHENALKDVAKASDLKYIGLRVVEIWRRGIRPMCTTISMGVIIALSWWAANLYTEHPEVLTTEQAYELFFYMIQTVCLISTTCILFWFTSRQPELLRLEKNE